MSTVLLDDRPSRRLVALPFLALLAWGVLPVVAETADAPGKPNIVFIIADDLGVGDLGCYGAAKIKTPNLDRLAAGGVRATEVCASAAVCTPSRYGILTGRDYWRIRTDWEGQSLIEPDRATVAKTLRDAGYRTGYFGKWHLGWGEVDPAKRRTHRAELDWNAAEIKPGVLEAGYDTFFGTPFSHNEPPLVFMQDRSVVKADPADPLELVKPEVEKHFGYGTSRGAKAAHEARPTDRIDMIVADKAAEFIAAKAPGPFYLNIAFVSPHVPIAPAPEFKKTSEAGAYGDYVAMLDHCVGRVLDALDKAGVADNTLVIFTSDNGAILHKEVHAAGHRANAARLGQKTDAWVGGLNVPFIARWPGRIPAGTTSGALISLNDFYATACAAASLPSPSGEGIDSINQLPVLEDPTAGSLRHEMTHLAITKPGVVLRSGDWLFIPAQGSLGVTTDPKMAWAMQYAEIGLVNSDFNVDGTLKPEAPPVQLYNLKEDSSQAVNLAAKNPDKVQELAVRLEEIRSSGR
jgi:arylsulfatase A-like enzyme